MFVLLMVFLDASLPVIYGIRCLVDGQHHRIFFNIFILLQLRSGALGLFLANQLASCVDNTIWYVLGS